MLPSAPYETPILPPRPNSTATPGASRSTLISGPGGGAGGVGAGGGCADAAATWPSRMAASRRRTASPFKRRRAPYLGRNEQELASMADLSAFPITARWPARHPDRLQLYGLPTPNGVKVSIMLEETGLPYEPHTINIGKNETWTPEYLALNPNGKIPAIIDPNGPNGTPFGLFESGAILLYLAEKTGKLLPSDPALRYET